MLKLQKAESIRTTHKSSGSVNKANDAGPHTPVKRHKTVVGPKVNGKV